MPDDIIEAIWSGSSSSHLERRTAFWLPAGCRLTENGQHDSLKRKGHLDALTFVSNEILDIVFPTKDNTEHLSSKVIRREARLVDWSRRPVRNITKPCTSIREKIDDRFLRAVEDFLL